MGLGFWGIVYYKHNTEPSKCSVRNYLAPDITQRPQYPLIKEYTLNNFRVPAII